MDHTTSNQPMKTPKLSVKDIIDRLGLSKTEVSKRLGVTFVTVDNWCNGKTQPRLDSYRKLVSLLEEVEVS